MAGYGDIIVNGQSGNGIAGPSMAPITSFGMPSFGASAPSSLNAQGFAEGLTAMPGIGGGAGGGGIFGDMTGLQKIGTGLSALNTIGGLYSAFGQLGLAKKQFKFQKDVMNTNLTNQIQAYNTALDDKARSRAVVEGQTDEERDAYIEKNKARRSGTNG